MHTAPAKQAAGAEQSSTPRAALSHNVALYMPSVCVGSMRMELGVQEAAKHWAEVLMRPLTETLQPHMQGCTAAPCMR